MQQAACSSRPSGGQASHIKQLHLHGLALLCGLQGHTRESAGGSAAEHKQWRKGSLLVGTRHAADTWQVRDTFGGWPGDSNAEPMQQHQVVSSL